MRVLLLSHSFPPDGEVGSLRAAKVSEAFAAAGHEVHVVTTRLGGELEAIRAPGDGITLRTVRALPHPRQAYQLAKSWFGRNGTSHLSAPDVPPSATSVLTRYLLSLLWLPDEHQGFIPPAVWACWDIHRRCGKVDLLYTTAPPFSAHLAGLIFKRMTGATWAAEFRDPWTDNPAKPARLRTRLSDAVDRRLERLCLRNADHIVAVTDAAHDLLARKVTPQRSQQFVMVRNGIDRLTPLGPSAPLPGLLRIVHSGSIYHRRDPRPFLRALASLHRRGRLGEGDVQVEFLGDRWFHHVSIEQVALDLGLSARVHCRGWVPQDVHHKVVEQAHLLLLFAQHEPASVQNKLFDYLGARKPVLAFADADGEVAQMLHRVGGHYLVTQDDPSVAETVLEKALSDLRMARGRHTNEEVLREWTTEHQMSRLLAALSGIGEDATRARLGR